jgi:hypothetical protein
MFQFAKIANQGQMQMVSLNIYIQFYFSTNIHILKWNSNLNINDHNTKIDKLN